MTNITLDILKTVLWTYAVRVRCVNGSEQLFVTDGNKLLPEMRQAVKDHRLELIEYYGRPEFFQDELDRLEGGINECGENSQESTTLWQAYYKTLEDRGLAMDHPWARISDDHKRCPTCPNLGKPATPEGILCAVPCKRVV